VKGFLRAAGSVEPEAQSIDASFGSHLIQTTEHRSQREPTLSRSSLSDERMLKIVGNNRPTQDRINAWKSLESGSNPEPDPTRMLIRELLER